SEDGPTMETVRKRFERTEPPQEVARPVEKINRKRLRKRGLNRINRLKRESADQPSPVGRWLRGPSPLSRPLSQPWSNLGISRLRLRQRFRQRPSKVNGGISETRPSGPEVKGSQIAALQTPGRRVMNRLFP